MRIRKVRVSVQALVEGKSAAGFLGQTYAHQEWIYVDLFPMTGEMITRFSGAGYDATWKAVGRNYPSIKDGSRVLVYPGTVSDEAPPPPEAVPSWTFEVVKALPRGRRQEILLKEVGAVNG